MGTPHRAVKLPPDMTRVDSIQWCCLNGHDYDGVYLHHPLALLYPVPVQVPEALGLRGGYLENCNLFHSEWSATQVLYTA